MSYFTDEQAIQIWKSRWLGEGVQALVVRYRESPFRFYEVWTEQRNQNTRLRAFEEFKREHPDRASKIDPTPHIPVRRVTVRLPAKAEQADLFA